MPCHWQLLRKADRNQALHRGPARRQTQLHLEHRGAKSGGDPTQMPTGAMCAYTPRKGELYVGVRGSLHRYKNGVWKKIPVEVGNINHAVWRVASNEQGIYAIVLSGDPVIEKRIYRLVGDTFEKLDTTPQSYGAYEKFGTSDIFLVKDRMITAGYGIMEAQFLSEGGIDTANWKTLFKTSGKAFWRGFMHNQKHIFSVGSGTLIYHFNGTDWAQLTNDKQPNPTTYSAVWADSGVVVICDYDYGKIYRGK